ncbi:UNVERIFIED_CONTAM: hypothetical protein GTU68_030343 [Idotea baltica]|nr:hypothetical protein [Idotea baltica]
MLLQLFIFLVSICVLLYSADLLVDAVKKLATSLGVSPYVIGLTVVAIGTSLPEVMASAVAAYQGVPAISVGNVIGSNICNIGLIIGLPALFFSINCSRSIILKQGVFMLLLSALFASLCLYGSFTRLVGFLFVATFGLFLFFAFRGDSGLEPEDLPEEELPKELPSDHSLVKTLLVVAGAFVLLLVSSHFLVDASVFLARHFSIPEAVIALLLISFGTSVPELSVSFAAARRQQGELLIGNILGSNISNISNISIFCWLLGQSSLISAIFRRKGLISGFELPFMGASGCSSCVYLLDLRVLAGTGEGSLVINLTLYFVAFAIALPVLPLGKLVGCISVMALCFSAKSAGRRQLLFLFL